MFTTTKAELAAEFLYYNSSMCTWEQFRIKKASYLEVENLVWNKISSYVIVVTKKHIQRAEIFP